MGRVINLTPEFSYKLKSYYASGKTLDEISNLCGVSYDYLTRFYRNCFKKGELKPRRGNRVFKSCRDKLTEEQMEAIAIDYYELGYTQKELFAKWEIHPMQLQRVRKLYGGNYSQKSCVPKKWMKNEKK